MACGDSYLRFHLEHPGAFRFLAFDDLAADAHDRPRAAARASPSGIDVLIDEFSAKIQEAIDSGEARPMDARLAGRFLWGAWNGTVALGLRRDGLALTETEIHDALQQAREMVNAGMCAPAARDSGGAPLTQLRATVSPPSDD